MGESRESRNQKCIRDIKIHRPGSLARKFKTTPSVRKIQASVFYSHKSVISVQFLGRGDAVTAVRYGGTLQRLEQAVSSKRPELLAQASSFHATMQVPLTDNRTNDWLRRYGWEVMDHVPCSPDLAPSDLHL